MDSTPAAWADADTFLAEQLLEPDPALDAALAAQRAAGLPEIEVAPLAGKLLNLLVRLSGARRVLEIGTLAGYSTIWFARAVGEAGRVVTLELEPSNAAVAQTNLERAGVVERVEIVVGPAAASAQALVAAGAEPFDLVFIDADKPSNPTYLAAALELTRSGAVIVVDNVVRNGAVVESDSQDASVQGVRALVDAVAAHPDLEATALQTVGLKGWDGFLIARRR